MANFEKYRKKNKTIKANLCEEHYNKFMKYLQENSLTQQKFIEEKILEVLKNAKRF